MTRRERDPRRRRAAREPSRASAPQGQVRRRTHACGSAPRAFQCTTLVLNGRVRSTGLLRAAHSGEVVLLHQRGSCSPAQTASSSRPSGARPVSSPYGQDRAAARPAARRPREGTWRRGRRHDPLGLHLTVVCKVLDGRLAVIDLLCSGFRDDEDLPASSGARLVGCLRPGRPLPAVRAGGVRRPRCTRSGSPTATPAWLVVGHEQARAALNDPRLSKDMHAAFTRSGEVVAEGLPGPALARHMLGVEPPDDTRLRRMAMPAFSRRRVGALEPRVRSIVERLLTDLEAHGGTDWVVDLVAGFGFPLPIYRDQRAARHPGAAQGRSRQVAAQPARPIAGLAASPRGRRGVGDDRRVPHRAARPHARPPARTSSPTSSSPPTATARSPSRRCSPRSSSSWSPATTPPPA